MAALMTRAIASGCESLDDNLKMTSCLVLEDSCVFGTCGQVKVYEW